ncbi:MAG: hypothetical protein LBR81_00180 [Prevotellaceae bacterium]|nr:hypothetical protein [Prevotellaceae bacterium]
MNFTNLKIIAILIAFVGINTTVYAQRYAVEGGYTLTALKQSHYGNAGNTNVLNGFHLGPKIEFAMPTLSPQFSMSVAALFEMRANRYDISWYRENTTATRILYYAYVPVNLNFIQPISKQLNLLIATGPRLSLGMWGETDEHPYMYTAPDNKNDHPFSQGGSMRSFDFAYGLSVGVEYQHFQFWLGYDLPFTNSSYNASPSLLKQHNLRFTTTFTIGALKK